MPVFLELVTSPLAQQDQIDIEKILSEVKVPWCAMELPAATNALELLNWLGHQRMLFASRFNDRILGLLVVQKPSQQAAPFAENRYNLHGVCVRPITRHRSVATQSLTRLCQWADQNNYELAIPMNTLESSNSLNSILEVHYFEPTSEAWVRVPRSATLG